MAKKGIFIRINEDLLEEIERICGNRTSAIECLLENALRSIKRKNRR